jgi:hypothetical protein
MAAKKKAPAAKAKGAPSLAGDTVQALAEVAAFDWKTASANRVPKVGAAYAKLVHAKADERAKARAEILATAGEHPIGGLLAPFLVRLLADPAVPDRAALCPLLATIAVGKRTLARFDAAAFVASLRRSRRERFEAVAKASPHALAMLSDPDEATRAGAAFLLAALQPAGQNDKLIGAVATETAALPLAAVLLALGIAARDPIAKEDHATLARFVRHEDPRVSLSAALALAIQPGPADDATLARVERELAASDPPWAGLPWAEGRLVDLAWDAYLPLADRHAERVIEHAAASCASALGPGKAPGPTVDRRVHALLALVASPPRSRTDALSATGAAALRAMLVTPGLIDARFAYDLQCKYRLPSDLVDLRDLAGLEIAAPPVIARRVVVDGIELPFHLAWLRFWWGRSRAIPERLAELGFAGLDASACIEAFHALTALQTAYGPAFAGELPDVPAGKRKEYPDAVQPIIAYVVDGPAMGPARALIATLREQGWTVVFEPPEHSHLGAACLVRGGASLNITTKAPRVDEGPSNASEILLTASYDPARLIAPVIHAAHGAALAPLVTELSQREDLANMPKWWTLSLASALAELSGEPPAPAVDGLFQRCYVSWTVSSWRAAYLKVVPPDRAEELALWLLSKDRCTWVADVVPTEKVKAIAAAK